MEVDRDQLDDQNMGTAAVMYVVRSGFPQCCSAFAVARLVFRVAVVWMRGGVRGYDVFQLRVQVLLLLFTVPRKG